MISLIAAKLYWPICTDVNKQWALANHVKLNLSQCLINIILQISSVRESPTVTVHSSISNAFQVGV